MACCEGFTPTGKEAFLVTEYEGITFQDGSGADTWGYHNKVADKEAFFMRHRDVTDTMRAIPFC